jgi:two-component system sensor histidine kinase KdpD
VGLGLTIVRAIVEAHGGRVTAHRRDGGGALFRIEVPRGRETPPVPPEKPEKAAAA